MTPESVQRKEDFRFIRTLLTAHDLGRVLRWRKPGQATFRSPEEVAEIKEDLLHHLCMMTLLLLAFTKKAAVEGDTKTACLDVPKVLMMILGHDADELYLGDTKGPKSSALRKMEKRAQATLFQELQKLNFGACIVADLEEYHRKESPEARFTKAIDEVQAWLYMIFVGKIHESSRDFCILADCPGYDFSQDFPTLKRVAGILLRIMRRPSLISPHVPEMVRQVL